METASLSLSDAYRTVVLHILEVQPEQFTWQLVLEEHCGAADCDCIIDAPLSWPTRAQAQAAGWAECNRLLQGARSSS